MVIVAVIWMLKCFSETGAVGTRWLEENNERTALGTKWDQMTKGKKAALWCHCDGCRLSSEDDKGDSLCESRATSPLAWCHVEWRWAGRTSHLPLSILNSSDSVMFCLWWLLYQITSSICVPEEPLDTSHAFPPISTVVTWNAHSHNSTS